MKLKINQRIKDFFEKSNIKKKLTTYRIEKSDFWQDKKNAEKNSVRRLI